MPFDQVEQHAGVQRSTASTHRQAFHRGEAHGTGHAFAVPHRAHAGAVAKMRHHRPPGRRRAHGLGQRPGDVFVRQTVEPIAPHPLFPVNARQGEQPRQFRLAKVERGIEAGHLRQIRLYRADGADAGQIMRLMQRRQRHEGFQASDDLRCQYLWVAVFLATMHHPMANRNHVG